MKKTAVVLCVILIVSLFAGCSSTAYQQITPNMFWNGILKDEDAVVYDQTDNPQRFGKTTTISNVQSVAIKDYDVYMLYEFENAAETFDALLPMLQSWQNNKADVECIASFSGLFYIMRGNADNCNVCYISGPTMVMGLGNLEDESAMISTIKTMTKSADTTYDDTNIETLVHTLNPVKQ